MRGMKIKMTRETKKLFKVKRKITPLTVLVPLLLVVASNVTYQLLCKNTPASLNPFTGLFASYGVSCLLCLVLMLVTKQGGIGEELRQIRPLNLILGLVIIGV